MLDQSFSAENFYKILKSENRKGVNLEKRFFVEEIFKKYTLEIRHLRNKSKKRYHRFLKESLRPVNPTEDVYNRYIQLIKYKEKKLIHEKRYSLFHQLEVISDNVQKPAYKLELKTHIHKGKTVYTIDDKPEHYFVMKQLQINFRRLFDVKQSNRHNITNQIRCLLDDKFHKVVLRTDIKDFYESINSKILLDKLLSDNLLSPSSKKIIKQIINSFNSISGKTNGIGIPRGIGISAYLAEYYLRRFDREISMLPNVSYYARYVDDIFIIRTPSYKDQGLDILNKVKDLIEKGETKLKLNLRKTNLIDLSLSQDHIKVNNMTINGSYKIYYLGYSYEISNNSKKNDIPPINISITPKKINKYKQKIRSSFLCFDRSKDKKKAFRLLKNRIKFLTGNTRLINNKSNVLVGIYYSNSLINEPSSLRVLDSYLNWHKRRFVKSSSLKVHLENYTFQRGFESRRFHVFKKKTFESIVKIWKFN